MWPSGGTWDQIHELGCSSVVECRDCFYGNQGGILQMKSECLSVHWRTLKCRLAVCINALLLFLIHRSMQEQRGYLTAYVDLSLSTVVLRLCIRGRWGFWAGFCAWFQCRHCPCLWSSRYPLGVGHERRLHARTGLSCDVLPSMLSQNMEKLKEHVLTLSFPAGVQGRDGERQLQDNSLTLCFLLEYDLEQLMLTGLEHQSNLLLAYLYVCSK